MGRLEKICVDLCIEMMQYFLGGLYSGLLSSATDDDFNALKGKTTAKKFTGYDTTNGVLKGHGSYGTIITIKADEYSVQWVFFPYDSTVFCRSSVENSWKAWKKITVTSV